ncbi:MAG TPA: hypothetical protein EYP78_03570 [Candidatus Omnitrophica bacterium]|nr:hypothetical protein [Candidatus Omnitrophota bacterium]
MWTIKVALACMCQHIDAQAKPLSPSLEKMQLVGTGQASPINMELITSLGEVRLVFVFSPKNFPFYRERANF